MSDRPDSLVLRFMRSLDMKFDRMANDIREIKDHVGAFEELYASVSRRLDFPELCLYRIESRLDLIDERTP